MAKSKKPGGGDGYDVGYRKPPRAGQFKPGQSGNPSGRKKQSVNISTVLEEVLSQTIEIIEDRKKQLVTIQKALILRWVQEALRGNVRAIEGVYDRRQRIELAAISSEQGEDAADAAMLERYIQVQVDAAITKLNRESAITSKQPEPESDGDV
jgi:hypothetical protein